MAQGNGLSSGDGFCAFVVRRSINQHGALRPPELSRPFLRRHRLVGDHVLEIALHFDRLRRLAIEAVGDLTRCQRALVRPVEQIPRDGTQRPWRGWRRLAAFGQGENEFYLPAPASFTKRMASASEISPPSINALTGGYGTPVSMTVPRTSLPSESIRTTTSCAPTA